MPPSELFKKQSETIKDFIEQEVLTHLDAHNSYCKKVNNWTKRFEAIRSIQGLSYGDDPDAFPKLEPWEGCYSPDTEVLTKRGWISIKDITTSDLVYSMNPMNQEAWWMPITNLQVNYYKEMIHFQGKSINLLVSPNHNMLIINKNWLTNVLFSHRDSLPAKFMKAQDLLKRKDTHYSIPLVSKFCHYKKIDKIYGFKAEDWLKFLGWYISEGWSAKSGTICISQSKNVNSDKCKKIEELLKRMRLSYSYNRHNFYVSCKKIPLEARQELKDLGLCYQKYIPEHYLDLEPYLLNILLTTLILGDGCIVKKENGRIHKMYYTTSKRLADNIQEIAQKIGLRATFYIRKKERKESIIKGRKIISKHQGYEISINTKQTTQIEKQKISIVQYNNLAYCCTTPFHTLYVRRNGKAIWCGNSADVGIPLEAITLRAIIARFVKTIFTKPICNVSGRGMMGEDQQAAKIVQEYNEYTLEDEMNFERNFYDIMMDVGLTGDGIGKLIEANEDYEWEETYFTLLHPETGEPMIDPSTKNEYDDNWPNGYPIEVAEDFEPKPDITTGVIPEVKEITVEKKDKVYFGTKLIPVDPKDLILPEGADTWDYDELPWVAHKFRKNWHWLKKKAGNPEDGFYDEEIIDKIKPRQDDKKVSTTDKIDLLEVWGQIDLPYGENKTKVKEIIALYAIENGELLGWIINPYRGKRMFFHWQIMPMSHRARGKSIPEFARGLRDLIDSLFNNMINRDTINSHPPFIYDEESGFDPEVHTFGPQEFWGVNDKTRLGRLDMGNYSEARSQWIIEFTLALLQKLFGVTDYTLGSESNIASNKTARGIMAIIGEGNFSFDTMITLLQMTNKKFFEANIRMHAKMMKDAGMENKVFFVTEAKENPYRKIAISSLSLNWNFIPRGTSVSDNIYRKRQDAQEAYALLSKNPLFSPQLSPTTLNNLREITQNLIDAYNLKTLKLPTQEELTQEMIKVKAMVQQEIMKKQQLEQLKKTAKFKKGTPEGIAAQKVLTDIEMGVQGTLPPMPYQKGMNE